MSTYTPTTATLRSPRTLALLALVFGLWLAGAPRALAQVTSPTPAWTISAVSMPTNFAPGSSFGTNGDHYSITVVNAGDAATDGSAIAVTDTLPTGLTLDSAGATGNDPQANAISCTSSGQTVTCTDPDTTALTTGQSISISVPVDVSSSAPAEVTNAVAVSGGGAANASASESTTISSSSAPFGPQGFVVSTSNNQAGAHPDLTTSFSFSTVLTQGNVEPNQSVKDIEVDLPAGLIGDPHAAATCTNAELESGGCPTSSQVGTVSLVAALFGPTPSPLTFPVYNVTPAPGQPATFAFAVLFPIAQLATSVRTGSDYGLTTTIGDVNQAAVVFGSTLTLWGIPADHNGSGAPRQAFLRNPTTCGGPLTTTLRVDSWQNPGTFVSATATTPAVIGCGEVGFDPSITVRPDTSAADSPSGIDVDVSVPQNSNPDGVAESDLQNASVTLPQGFSISPSSADGLHACSPAQIALGSAAQASCPSSSTIGTAEIDSPLLSDPLKGSIYLAQQGQNPFNSLLAIYVVAQADGVLLKLPGRIDLNPTTGQVTTTFDNDPQLPFTDFKLDFFGGPRAVIASPTACGTYSATSQITGWNGATASPSGGSFTIDSGCVNGFAPTFTAGVTNVQAGAYTPFVLSFSRGDTDQGLSGLSVTLPPGLLARPAGVPLCSDADANAGTCPSDSQVGTVRIASGAGSDPFFLPGIVYLTGPYKGGPYGLAVVTPAVAGPLNLGTVVVRQSIQINPTNAQVTVVSDPLPSILDGIPLRLRRVDVTLDRPGFMINPTSCNATLLTATLTSTGGLSAPVSSRFQVGDCAGLGFGPKLKLGLTGKHQTRSGSHPTLTATLTTRSGQANLRTAKVTLPLSLALDPKNSQHLCSYAVAQAVHGGAVGCPASSIVGSATAVTPLLSGPLSGPVYLVQGIRISHGQQIRTLPSLLIPLRGQLALDLRATTSVNSASKLVTTFASIPDAPVSKFTLTISGGRRGLLVITGRSRNICSAPQVATATLGAQSGKSVALTTKLSKPCGKAKKSKPKKKK